MITSATIDAERFSQHFADADGPAPIIEVSGRTYPVEVRYRPLAASDDEEEDLDATDTLVAAVHELASGGRGDILVFLPTERDIRETARRLRGEASAGHIPQQTEILPLYARLSAAEQHRIFQLGSHRRIVLATNVAESSLTVPNIHYVVDTGTARISRYAPRSKVQRLPIEAISRIGRPAQRPLRPPRARDLHPSLQRRRLPAPGRLHDARNSPHQPGVGHPASQGAAAGRGRSDSVPGSAPSRSRARRVPNAVRNRGGR